MVGIKFYIKIKKSIKPKLDKIIYEIISYSKIYCICDWPYLKLTYTLYLPYLASIDAFWVVKFFDLKWIAFHPFCSINTTESILNINLIKCSNRVPKRKHSSFCSCSSLQVLAPQM